MDEHPKKKRDISPQFPELKTVAEVRELHASNTPVALVQLDKSTVAVFNALQYLNKYIRFEAFEVSTFISSAP
jgi:capsule polysaccharide modification protein KpsS